MKKVFATTKNVREFVAGMDAVRGDGRRKAEMGLVYGAYGTGKTVTAQKYAADHGLTYVAAVDGMTRRSLLAAIIGELGYSPAWATDAAFHQAVDLLLEPGRCLIVDEVDYLIQTGVIETLRSLYDYTACPIVMVGMAPDLPQKLKARWPWLFDRCGTLVRFSTFTAEELGEMAEQLCEVAFEASALALVRAKSEGRLRPALRAFERAEAVARTNRLERIGPEHLRGIWSNDDEPGAAGRRVRR